MIRRAAVVVLALALNPAMLRAQDTVFTVNVASADIYRGPSTGNPVIGHATRGTVLAISRNLGSWIKVAWPEAPDGVGYIHTSMGHIGAPGPNAPVTRVPAQSSSAPTAAAPPASSPTPAAASTAPRAAASQPVVSHRRVSVTPAEHMFGVGGLLGTMSTYGATTRMWPNKHVGIQVGFTRDQMSTSIDDAHVTSWQVEPGVMYGFFDHVSDYIWVRPYAGSTVTFGQQQLKLADEVTPGRPADSGMGFRFFGGTELMFASMPRFGVSADVGYRRLPTKYPGFDPSPLSVRIAGHWYVK